ncbi:hypothetical protein LTS08_007570 [Lithohypha guttulata]|nr:hypothetical protein LTS08_007570 [Lithohypha guttulata]
MHQAKRRRLNDTASVLSKPFRSPLKLTSKSHPSSAEATKHNVEQQVRDQDAISRETNDQESNAASPKKPSVFYTAHHHEIDAKSTTVDDIDKLQREYAALGQELRRYRQDLDVLQQAHTLRSGNQQAKVDGLVLKWKTIARDAADDLFQSTSDRIKQMGGLQVWQKNASQCQVDDWYNSKEDQPFSDDESGDHELKQQALMSKKIKRPEAMPQFYTMDVMLQQLNIDPGLLNFDPATEQWRD